MRKGTIVSHVAQSRAHTFPTLLHPSKTAGFPQTPAATPNLPFIAILQPDKFSALNRARHPFCSRSTVDGVNNALI